MNADKLKKIVAERAVDDYVRDGMNVGLGTGSTAYHAINRIGELVAGGFSLTCVATSIRSREQALDLGINVVDLDAAPYLDVTIDGADEVDPNLQLIKGLGGALLMEKIVAAASKSEVIVVDESKLVELLGTKSPLPVEVLEFGHGKTASMLSEIGCDPVLRMAGDAPFRTDCGNLIYDCRFDGIGNPHAIEASINTVPGVVDNGLFLDMATTVLVSREDGTVDRFGV